MSGRNKMLEDEKKRIHLKKKSRDLLFALRTSGNDPAPLLEVLEIRRDAKGRGPR